MYGGRIVGGHGWRGQLVGSDSSRGRVCGWPWLVGASGRWPWLRKKSFRGKYPSSDRMMIISRVIIQGQRVFHQWPVQRGRIVGRHGEGKIIPRKSAPHPIEGDYLGSESILRVALGGPESIIRVADGGAIFKGQGSISRVVMTPLDGGGLGGGHWYFTIGHDPAVGGEDILRVAMVPEK